MRTGRAVWWAAAIGGIALGGSAFFYIASNDFFGHLAQGREIFELGRVPHTDGRSVLWDEPRPWANYEWLFDVALWWMHSLGGDAAVILFKVLTMFVTGAALVWLAASMSERAPVAAAWTAVAVLMAVAPAVRVRMTVRPHVPGFLFVALLLCGLWVLSRPRWRRRWAVIGSLVAMHVVWVNTHGSHLFGVATAGLFAVVAFGTPAFGPLLALVVGQLVVSGATPFGFSILTDAIEHIVNPEYREIVTDWVAWNPSMPVSWLALCTLQALLVIVSLRPVLRLGRFGIAYGFLCIVLTLMAFRSTRFMSYLLLFAAPFVAAGLSMWGERLLTGPSVRSAIGAALILVGPWCVYGVMTLPPKVPLGIGVSERGFAWSSARYLQREVRPHRLFSDPMQGWILMYALPDAKLTIDPRFPFYGVEATNLVRTALAEPKLLRPFLDKHKLDRAVVRHLLKPGPKAAAALSEWPEWAPVHIENAHALFARRGTETTAAFKWLPMGFDPWRLLDASTPVDAVVAEVERLGEDPNGQAYRQWVRGLLALRPALRSGGKTGLRTSVSQERRAFAEKASVLLAEAADEFPGLPTVEVYRALAAVASCDLAGAHEALDRIKTPSREVTLARLEASLRSPTPDVRRAAAQDLDKFAGMPELKEQPWLSVLARSIGEMRLCRATEP